MSDFTGHATAGLIGSTITGGILLYAKYKYNLNYEDVFVPSLSLFLFSLFPDIDIKSISSRIIYSLIIILLGYCYFKGKFQTGNLIGILSIIPQLVSHRGLFHSPVTACILPGFIFYFYYIGDITLSLAIITYIASIIGYYIHLMLDNI